VKINHKISLTVLKSKRLNIFFMPELVSAGPFFNHKSAWTHNKGIQTRNLSVGSSERKIINACNEVLYKFLSVTTRYTRGPKREDGLPIFVQTGSKGAQMTYNSGIWDKIRAIVEGNLGVCGFVTCLLPHCGL
jgi:hypothetical protein